MKTFTLLCLTLLCSQVSLASHLLGGYIQAKPVANSTTTYEITVTLYLNTTSGSAAVTNMGSVSLCLGDGSVAEANQELIQPLSTDKTISRGVFRTTHTYAGPGTYTITTVILNRTNVQNISRAADTPFALTTTISTSVLNQTPTLSVPETGFVVGINQRVVFPLRSTDSEGDSLAYSLAKPLSGMANSVCKVLPLDSYQFPNNLTRQGTFTVNSRSGDLTWNQPTQMGYFSVAVLVSEYRQRVLISQTLQEVVLLVADRPGTTAPIPPYEPTVEGGFDGTLVTAVPTYRDGDMVLTVFPNPVDDRLQVVIQTSKSTTALIQLLDVSGRKLHELAFRKGARQHEQMISMDSLTPGVYFLRAEVDGRSQVRKILKR